MNFLVITCLLQKARLTNIEVRRNRQFTRPRKSLVQQNYGAHTFKRVRQTWSAIKPTTINSSRRSSKLAIGTQNWRPPPSLRLGFPWNPQHSNHQSSICRAWPRIQYHDCCGELPDSNRNRSERRSPLFWVPLANKYGRRPIYLVTTFLGFVSALGCAYSQNYAQLLVARFFNGFFPVGMALAAVSVVDLFFFHRRGRAMGIFTVLMTNEGHLAPIVGGLIGQFLGCVVKTERKRLGGADLPPEARLKAIWTGQILAPVGLLIYGFCIQYSEHWIGGLIGMGTACFGIQVVTTTCYTYSIDCYRPDGSEVCTHAPPDLSGTC